MLLIQKSPIKSGIKTNDDGTHNDLLKIQKSPIKSGIKTITFDALSGSFSNSKKPHQIGD